MNFGFFDQNRKFIRRIFHIRIFKMIYDISSLEQTPNLNTLIGHVLTFFFFFLSLIVDVRRF
jgi:hypothetical protein